jgi:creatinine amidohydrolase
LTRLQHATWPAVEAHLERSKGIVIPAGSTEQHGAQGLIGTDALCAEAIAAGVGDAADALVAPTLAMGPAQFNLGFAGTLTTRPTTFIALVEDMVRSLAVHGFERFYFVNGHGANVAALRAAFQEIYAAASLAPGGNRPAVRCRVRSWWDLPRVDALRRALYGDAEGMHVTPSEVALTQHLFPDSIGPVTAGPAPAMSPEARRDHAGDDHYDAADHRRRYADGLVGSDPSLATAADGKRLYEAAVADAVADYYAFLAED